MADLDDDDDEAMILDPADEAVVTEPIAPIAGHRAFKAFAKAFANQSGIKACKDTLIKIVADRLLPSCAQNFGQKNRRFCPVG